MKKKLRICLIILTAVILAAVSFFKPEYAENIARAFMLVIAGV